jgi:hypothetical protein
MSNQALAELTPPQQSAKERGLALYNQYKPATVELRIAADAGDAESQYRKNGMKPLQVKASFMLHYDYQSQITTYAQS